MFAQSQSVNGRMISDHRKVFVGMDFQPHHVYHGVGDTEVLERSLHIYIMDQGNTIDLLENDISIDDVWIFAITRSQNSTVGQKAIDNSCLFFCCKTLRDAFTKVSATNEAIQDEATKARSPVHSMIVSRSAIFSCIVVLKVNDCLSCLCQSLIVFREYRDGPLVCSK